jgi:hypothetical protein
MARNVLCVQVIMTGGTRAAREKPKNNSPWERVDGII